MDRAIGRSVLETKAKAAGLEQGMEDMLSVDVMTAPGRTQSDGWADTMPAANYVIGVHTEVALMRLLAVARLLACVRQMSMQQLT